MSKSYVPAFAIPWPHPQLEYEFSSIFNNTRSLCEILKKKKMWTNLIVEQFWVTVKVVIFNEISCSAKKMNIIVYFTL